MLGHQLYMVNGTTPRFLDLGAALQHVRQSARPQGTAPSQAQAQLSHRLGFCRRKQLTEKPASFSVCTQEPS